MTNWHHPPSSHVGHRKNLPESEGSSMTRSTRVALRDPRMVSTIPLTNPPPEHHTIFSHVSTESHATKPSRRWQPPRVTSTTDLQLNHLVPLDAISQCNRTRITHSQSIRTVASTSELEALLALLKHGHQVPRVPSICQGRPHTPLIAPRAKIAVTPFVLISTY